MKSGIAQLYDLVFRPKKAYEFSAYNPGRPGVADDGLSKPGDLENFLRNTPVVNALFGEKIADQMSADRWSDDYYTLYGKSPSDDYYPHLHKQLQNGGSGAMAVYNALKGGLSTVSSAASVVPTPYATDNESNEKLKKIYG